jgi:hypothetical protein
MITYLGPLLVFLGVLLAVRGVTWNSDATGIRKITVTGWLTILVAASGLVVALIGIHDTNTTNATNAQRLIQAKENAVQANNTIQELKGKLATYEELLLDVKEITNRQLQMVMTQYVSLKPHEIWEAPNKIFPGSVVKFMLWESSISLEYGNVRQVIRASRAQTVEIPIVGASGEPHTWIIRNLSSTNVSGKIFVFSSPRSRSVEWSWTEERENTEEPEMFFARVLSFLNNPKDSTDFPRTALFSVRGPEGDGDVINIGEVRLKRWLTFWAQYGGQRDTFEGHFFYSNLQRLFFTYLESQGYTFSSVADKSMPGWTNKVYLFRQRNGERSFYVQYESESNRSHSSGYAKIHLAQPE